MAHPVAQAPNGDELNYPDKRGTYVKCLDHDSPGLVKLSAFDAFRQALGKYHPGTHTYSAGTANFETTPSILGAGRKLNDPQAAFAQSIVGGDPDQFGRDFVPAAPEVKSPEYATELLELYWASFLRDVPFSQYGTNNIANAAAAELSVHSQYYAGPLDNTGKVTPELLFRGGGKKFGPGKNEKWFDGASDGPYLSQFCILPTQFGAQPIDQKLQISAPNVDYLYDFGMWYDVQRGVAPAAVPPLSETRYLHDGRGLCAYTHVDELYQAYFIAYLVLNTLKVPANVGSPYNTYKAQQPFGTFGGPDIAAMLAAVAKMALNVVWYQKWVVHLRHRPESGGGLVDMIKTGYKAPGQNQPLYTGNDLHSIILNSDAVQKSHNRWGSYLLSQSFPEGSPAHPAYPTGHGTVAGACITVLKFFFKGDYMLANPMMPSEEGKSLVPFMGKLTVNGELHKLAYNISFGHGVHAGIHWRSDTDYSIALGEAIALNFLEQEKETYKEPFSITLTKINGESHTITHS